MGENTDKTKIMILGAAGMLGHKLVQQLSPRFDVYATIRKEFASIERYGIFSRERIIENVDAKSEASLTQVLADIAPDVVINAVGIVKQVPSAKDVITTLELNSILPQRLAILCAEIKARLIHISTDCVFDGTKGMYTESDIPDAADLYGRSKQLGEVIGANCLTIRSSIIGRELSTSHSLIEWFLSNRDRPGAVAGFTTAIYSGFPTVVFADIISSLITEYKELSGLYHIAAEPIDKYSLLQLVDEYYDAGIELAPSDQLVIDRSLDGSRYNDLTGFVPPGWPEMIDRMANDPTPYDKFHK